MIVAGFMPSAEAVVCEETVAEILDVLGRFPARHIDAVLGEMRGDSDVDLAARWHTSVDTVVSIRRATRAFLARHLDRLLEVPA